MVKAKTPKAKPTRPVLFWQVKVKATFFSDGIEMVKFSPRKAMTTKGLLVEFKDSDTVQVKNS